MRATNRLITVALVGLTLTSCGGKGTNATPTTPTASTPPAIGPVDPALVGTWNGSLDGSFGAGSFSMILSSSASITTVNTGGSSNYCAVSGDWGVAAGQFTARGRDCTSTVVTFTAPASPTTMSGTWTASSGRSGAFAVTKQ